MNIYQQIPSLYTLIPYDYAVIKNSKYDSLLDNFLKDIPAQKNPKLIQISGIPGAGKTTYCQKNKGENSVFISFDKIMESLPDYQKDVKEKGSFEAFKTWEIPARVLGYELLNRALTKKCDILLEHSGVNKAHVDLFKLLSSQGYETQVLFIECPVEKALIRVKNREKETHRYTPKELILTRASKIEAYKKIYQTITKTQMITPSFEVESISCLLKKKQKELT